MSDLINLRAISDNEDMVHHFGFGPVPLGTIHEFDGKKYKATNNYQTTITSYKPAEDADQSVSKALSEVQEWTDYMRAKFYDGEINLKNLDEIDKIHSIIRG